MKIFSLLIIFLISLISINAQNELTTDAVIQQETQEIIDDTEIDPELEDVGVTPDQAGYGLKLSAEKLRLFFTFDKARKAQAALDLAELRLKEARLMISQDKFESLDKIRDEHKKYLDTAKQNIDDLKENEGSLETQAELEASLDNQESQIADIDSLLLLKSPDLTDEQEDYLIDFVDEIESENDEVELEVRNKGTNIKLRLSANGLAEDNIQGTLDFHRNISKNLTRDDILERMAIHQVSQSEKMYNLARRLIEKAQVMNNTNSTINFTLGPRTLELYGEAKVKLDLAKTELEQMHYQLAIGYAHQSKRLSGLAIASIHHGISPIALENRLDKIEDLLKDRGHRGKGINEEFEGEIEIENDDDLKDEIEDELDEDNNEEDEGDNNRTGSNSGSNGY